MSTICPFCESENTRSFLKLKDYFLSQKTSRYVSATTASCYSPLPDQISPLLENIINPKTI